MPGLNIAQIKGRAKALTGRDISEQEADDILSQAWDQSQYGADASAVDMLLSGGATQDPVQGFIDAQLEVYEKTYGEAERKLREFDEKNPFIFDEELARASSEERFDPFYDAELKDFMTGVERQRGRTVQDEERLRRELTASTESYVGKARRQIDQALESSREGFAGAGLFFSGKRLRREGEIGIEGEQGISDFQRQQGIRREESGLREARGLEDIGLREGTYRRQQKAGRETAILGDVAQQRGEQLKQREFERQQIAGPFLSNSTGSLNFLLS